MVPGERGRVEGDAGLEGVKDERMRPCLVLFQLLLWIRDYGPIRAVDIMGFRISGILASGVWTYCRHCLGGLAFTTTRRVYIDEVVANVLCHQSRY